MPPAIEISNETYSLLQKVAVPFVDTPESVIRRAVEKLMESSTHAVPATPVHSAEVYNSAAVDESSTVSALETDDPLVFECTRLPDVTHTTFVSGLVAGIKVHDWNELYLFVHAEVLAKVGSVDELRRATAANIKTGTHFEHGFKTRKGLPFSIQGAEANKACSIAFRLAREYKIPLRAEFRWQNKAKAAFPGRVGRVEWAPPTA